MMCRFLSADFELSLKCPVDKTKHRRPIPSLSRSCATIRWMSSPAMPRPIVEQLTCGKNCRALLESGHYWQRIYPESAIYTPEPIKTFSIG